MKDLLNTNHFGNNIEEKVYLHLENEMAFGYQESRSTNDMFPNPKPHCLSFWEGILAGSDSQVTLQSNENPGIWGPVAVI